MVAEVESLLGQYLLDSLHVVHDVFFQLGVALNILVEGNEFNFLDNIDIVSLWHFCD